MTAGVTSTPLGQVLDYEGSIRNPSPFPLGLLPYPGLEGSEDWRAAFCQGLPRWGGLPGSKWAGGG